MRSSVTAAEGMPKRSANARAFAGEEPVTSTTRQRLDSPSAVAKSAAIAPVPTIPKLSFPVIVSSFDDLTSKLHGVNQENMCRAVLPQPGVERILDAYRRAQHRIHLRRPAQS